MRYVLFSLFFVFASANELPEGLLSDSKAKELRYEDEKVDVESSILRDSWLNPITGSYSGSFKEQFGQEQESYTTQIGIDQPIFKSGGIYFAIKYANATAHYNKLGIQMKTKTIIKETMALMLNLRKIDVEIHKLRLLYKDATETFEYNKQQLSAGEVDQATVNINEITKNSLNMNLLDLENQRDGLLHQLFIFSDADYKTIKLPKLTLVEKENFLKHNMVLQQSLAKNSQNEYFKKVTISNYLPTVSAQVSYVLSKNVNQAFSETFVLNNETEYLNYGFRISMPIFDVNILRNIESAKVDHLKAAVEVTAKQKEMGHFYKMVVAKVKRINQKISIAKDNLLLYDKVLLNTKVSFEAGDRSSIDLSKSRNELVTRRLDIQVYEFDKQLELLSLYEKMGGA